ncbi:hypothetical protein N431DRAFT_541778 [Stipitochalara longipes BDJ]|nr:hypothetical protein N431DRAFT_541778 [Stipitochalara longipes BDJ]
MRFFVVLSLSLLVAIAAAQLQPRQTATIPDFVTKYAPLVYLDQNEIYLPSDIQAQLNNTYPALNFTALPKADVPSPLLLSDLEQLNILGNCGEDFDACPIYLTSKIDAATYPPWFNGTLPDPVTGETAGVTSCAIIVNDHGNGLVDAYYMYFYAFNLGDNIYGQLLGNHVGDWEHSMVRFQNGTPISVWLSQHEYGQAFTYKALSKKGVRPIIYSANGGHPNYAVPGLHSRNVSIIVVNDTTSAGPLWDPTLSAYFYTYTPSSTENGTFVASNSSTPVGWLHFEGRWGDEQYLDSDPRQVNFLNASIAWKWETGPTGPLDKDLNRTDVCPSASGTPCVTLSVLPATSGSSIPVTVTRTTSTQGSVPTGTGGGKSISSTAGSTGTSTGAAKPTGAAVSLNVNIGLTFWGAVVALLVW